MLYAKFLKPVIDRLAGLIILILIFPILLLLFLVICIDSSGGPIFTQQRVGLGGRIFTIYKLRTMYVNAEQLGPHFTLENDCRITRVGKFLRITSLDELPQLWNLLNGTMSLVGPRPDVPDQRKLYSEAEWIERHSVKPGITGLAQALFRSQISQNERIRLDLEYVRNLSLWLDLKIIFMTVKKVFECKDSN